MADLTVTRQDVQIMESGAVTKLFQAGETINQGQSFYIHTDDKCYLTDSDDVSKSTAQGVALTCAMVDDFFIAVTNGKYHPGATVVVGTTYVASTTPGGIAPEADLGTGDFVSVIGIAVAATTIDVKLHNTGIAKP